MEHPGTRQVARPRFLQGGSGASRIANPLRAAADSTLIDVRLQCDLLDRNGFDVPAVLDRAGLPPSVLISPDVRVSDRQEQALLSQFAVVTQHRPDLWMASARNHAYTGWGEYGMALITSPTLMHATRLGVNYGGGGARYARAQQNRWTVGLEVSFNEEYKVGTPEFDYRVLREVVSGIDTYVSLWGENFPFTRIESPIDLTPFGVTDITDAPIHPSNDDRIRLLWAAELEDVPLPRGNSVIHHQYVTSLNRVNRSATVAVDIEDQVRATVARSHDPATAMSLADVAQELGLTPRTLQRRLTARGVAFTTLRDHVRLERAKRLLASTGSSIGEIARQVGYLEVSSFSQAFRRWAGVSPREYRRRHAA